MTVTAGRPGTWRSQSATWFVGLTSAAIVVFALTPYLTSSLQELGADPMSIAATYAGTPVAVQVAFYLHVSFGGLALLLPCSSRGGSGPGCHGCTGRWAGWCSARSPSPGAPRW